MPNRIEAGQRYRWDYRGSSSNLLPYKGTVVTVMGAEPDMAGGWQVRTEDGRTRVAFTKDLKEVAEHGEG